MPQPRSTVVGVAIVAGGRVLAARRTTPPGWELPGGKVVPGEGREAAAVREIREELGCTVEVTGWLPGSVPIDDGLELVVCTARLVAGEPVPVEHDLVWWLPLERLEGIDAVDWLAADRPFVAALREAAGSLP